jgi:hydrogenase expression/formation protein HypE
MKKNPLGKDARVIGKVVKDHPGLVTIKTSIGTSRILEMLSGEQLPRIC